MKTLFITGASSGIGRETVKYFQTKGWNVAATMRNPSKETELTQLANVECFPLEVTDVDSIRQAIADAISAFGSIDVLCNNAGFSVVGAFEATNQEQIERQFAVNFTGTLNVMREVLPYFKQKKAGAIINLASIGAELGFPLYSIYNASKFAVAGFTEAVSYEMDLYNIRMRCIEPGIIKTDFYTRSYNLAYDEKLKEINDFYIGDAKEKIAGYGADGSDPVLIAKLIYKAANSKSKKLIYRAGRYSFLPILRQILPFGLLKALIRNNYKVS